MSDESGQCQSDDKKDGSQINSCLCEMTSGFTAENRLTDTAESRPHAAGFGGLEQDQTDQKH